MGCVVLDDFLYVLGGTNRHNEVLQVTVQCDVSGAYPDCGLRIFKIIGSATLLISNDVDPDPVGSAFIWVRGSGSAFRRYIMKGKAEFNQQIFGVFFRRKLYFSSLNLKKAANL